VHSLMLDLALYRIARLLKHPVHPFIEEQAWAVDELVHHARWQIIRQAAAVQRRRRTRGWNNFQRIHSLSRHTMMHGAFNDVYDFPSDVITRSPRPSASPRFTNRT